MNEQYEWFSEEELDEIILALGEQIKEEDSKTAIIIPQRISQMQMVYQIAAHLAKDNGAEVSYQLNAPFKSMGSVTMEGIDFVFKDTKLLAQAIQLSDNVEIYPLTNGSVRMTFTFHRLTRPIE